MRVSLLVVAGDRPRRSSLAACGERTRRRRRQQQRQRQLDHGRRRARAAASTSTPRTARPTRAPSTITGDTIKIGTSLPQSGIYAAFSAILNGEQAYFDYINDAKGGVEIAGKKYKIELVAKDDAYDAPRTVHERAVARRRRRRLRALQRRRHEEQPRDPRLRERRTASRTSSRRPARRSGATTTTRG